VSGGVSLSDQPHPSRDSNEKIPTLDSRNSDGNTKDIIKTFGTYP
jgi:hypothetical protein